MSRNRKFLSMFLPSHKRPSRPGSSYGGRKSSFDPDEQPTYIPEDHVDDIDCEPGYSYIPIEIHHASPQIVKKEPATIDPMALYAKVNKQRPESSQRNERDNALITQNLIHSNENEIPTREAKATQIDQRILDEKPLISVRPKQLDTPRQKAKRKHKSSGRSRTKLKSINLRRLYNVEHHNEEERQPFSDDDHHKNNKAHTKKNSRANTVDVYKQENKIIQEIIKNHKEELKHLGKELQSTVKENEALHQLVDEMKEEENKWKDEANQMTNQQEEYLAMLRKNINLNQRISKLENDTRVEVANLCKQITVIKQENDHLSQQLSTIRKENQELQKKYNEVCTEKRSMVPREEYLKTIKEHHGQLEEIKQIQVKEFQQLQKLHESVEDEKNTLKIELKLLQEDMKRAKMANKNLLEEKEALETSQTEAKLKYDSLSKEMEQTKEQEIRHKRLMQSLVEVAEKVVMERDILLKKEKLQEMKVTSVHSSIMEFSLDVGRLQEHIMNTHRKMNEEMQKALTSAKDKETSYSFMKQTYEMQIDILRKKIYNANDMTNTLQREKSELQVDFENMWLNICLDKGTGNTL